MGLTEAKEPEIFRAIRFGAVLENVVFDQQTRIVDYDDCTLTENTRWYVISFHRPSCSSFLSSLFHEQSFPPFPLPYRDDDADATGSAYPIEHIPTAKIPCITPSHPSNIILLTCDARGVLPPISKLTSEQMMFHFISGYTSKMVGTEDGVTEPQATFSSCFAQPFLALHPMRYAQMLADKVSHHKADAWLLNTGWAGASVTKGGKRCPCVSIASKLTSLPLDV